MSFLELLSGPKDASRNNADATVSEAPQQHRTASVPCSAVGCLPYSSNENEDCVHAAVDTVNGGCFGNVLKATPLAPFDVICGQSWVFDDGSGPKRDVDWYITNTLWNDLLTWDITAEFDFDYEIWHMYACVGASWQILAGSGSACETTSISLRGSGDYPLAIAIYPSVTNVTSMPCDLGPWNYHISLIRNCEITCPPGSVDEGEGCSADPSIDNFNGGCFASPVVYSTITSGQPVCGQISSQGDWRDTDWYRTNSPLKVGDIVSWRVTANFPAIMAVFDQRHGCVTREIAGVIGDACDPSLVEWQVDSAGIYTFVVGALATSHGYPCAEGPWTYVSALEICTFGCASGGTPEGEDCAEYNGDYYNGGCNSPVYALQPIGLGERICGQAWRLSACGNDQCYLERDTDWFVYEATAGEVLTWTVRAAYGVDIGVFHPYPDNPCAIVSFAPYTWTTSGCYPLSLTYQVPDSGPVIFYVAPGIPLLLPGPQLPCNAGPWEYEAIIESAPCVCDCPADPQCDGVIDIFDVTSAVNVAFRNAAAMPDPNVACPWDKTDVNCDGVTDVFDVTKFVNVAFRNGDPASEFCEPCALSGEPQ